MNKIHEKFIKTYTMNKIDDLCGILDNLSDEKREVFLDPLYIQIVGMSGDFFNPQNENKTLGEIN